MRKIPRKNLRRKKTASTVFGIRSTQSHHEGQRWLPSRATIRAKVAQGAAGLAQQVRKIEVFFKRLSVQKSPKGAARLAQRVRKIEGTLHPCKSLHRETVHAKTDYRRSWTDILNVLDQVRNAPMNIAECAKSHNLIIQTIVTHVQRGHHTLHWFNLQNDSHLPIVKQHYPQLLTLKKTSQLPLTHARPSRRGQQFPLASPAHTKPTTIHFTHSTLRHRSSPPTPSTRTRQNFSIRNTRRSLRHSHIQSHKVIQVLIRRLFRPHYRTPRVIKLRKLRRRLIRFISSDHGRSRHKISSSGCMHRPKILNLRSNQGSVTQTKFSNYPTPTKPPAKT
jgi:hypothetical protein